MKRRILLVDDDLAILLTLKAILEMNGFSVETAASAREAKAKLRTLDFHMVISDLRMESENAGLDVAKAARQAPSQPAIALLTAFPLPEQEWRQQGMDRMLVKPVNTEELLGQIEALLVAQQDKKHAAKKKAAGSIATASKKRTKVAEPAR